MLIAFPRHGAQGCNQACAGSLGDPFEKKAPPELFILCAGYVAYPVEKNVVPKRFDLEYFGKSSDFWNGYAT